MEKVKLKTEYLELLKLSYDELVKYLLDKYGAVQGDYFRNEKCISKNNKISRMDEGLFCHHIDEIKAILLSTREYAQANPFEYQKAHRLVYCDTMEHLILHTKIVRERSCINSDVGMGGVEMISSQLNGFYMSKERERKDWRANANRVVKGQYDIYLFIMRDFLDYLKTDELYKTRDNEKILSSNWNGDSYYKIYNDFIKR